MKLYDRINAGAVYFIAEMSANHAGSLENALEIVKAAKAAGADCLKVQTYTADGMTMDCDNEYFRIKDGLWEGYNLYQLYREARTPLEWHKAIRDECVKLELDFLSTPFDQKAVDFLEALEVKFYKIASFELVDIPLIEYVASKQKPVLLSCGMGSVEEIRDAVAACRRSGNNDIILLKCTSAYPSMIEDMNLSAIENMKSRFGLPAGLSDHSMGSLAPVVAASLGAVVIEKHFCLSRTMQSPDSAFSMEPDEYRQMVVSVNQALAARGDAKYGPAGAEGKSLAFRRSIFAIKDIAAGEAFTKENIRVIRPGYGLKPKYYPQLLTRRAGRAYSAGVPVNEPVSDKAAAFSSERLHYTEISWEDAEWIVNWRSDPDESKYFKNTAPINMESHLNWYQTYLTDHSRIDFIISIREDGRKIGVVTLTEIDYVRRTCKIGYMIGEKAARGVGYAKEAVRGLIEYGRERYHIVEFIAEIHENNAASMELIRSLGFEKDPFRPYVKVTL